MITPSSFSRYLSDIKFTGQAGERTISRLVKANQVQEQTREQLGYPANRFKSEAEEQEQTSEQKAARYDKQMKLTAARAALKTSGSIDDDYNYARLFGFGNCGENSTVTFYNLCKAFPNGEEGEDVCDVHALRYVEEDHAFNKVEFSDSAETIIADSWGDGHPVLASHYQKLEEGIETWLQTEGDNEEYAEEVDSFSSEGHARLLKRLNKKYEQFQNANIHHTFFYYNQHSPNLSSEAIEKDVSARKKAVTEQLRKEDVDLESFDTEQVRSKYDVMRDIRAASIEKEHLSL